MKKFLSLGIRSLFLSGLILLMYQQSYATHIFAMDLKYTWVSGNTYNVQVIVYGNCGGSAFSTLGSSRPIICTYNGNTFSRTDTLALQTSDSGTNVTQVCPAYIDSTTCTHPSSTLEGTERYIYSKNITLSGTSTVWRFRCGHFMGTDPGRSTTITNIVGAGTSITYLEDTLNNSTAPSSGHNSSPSFGSLPTPYYCVNNPNTYSPVPSDPDGDALTFELVAGRTTGGGNCSSTPTNVTYTTGGFAYSATTPIDVTTPITFSTTTGQIAFTPVNVEEDLIVYNVEERRGGVLVGTCQREMTFNIKSCTLTPPSDAFRNPSTGALSDSFTLNVCNNAGAFTVNIDPTITGGYLIYVDTLIPSGMPTGMTFTVAGDSTAAPVVTIGWNTTGVPIGAYTFYLSYFVNSCPVGGTSTVGYTINVDSAAGAITGPLTVCPLLTTTLNATPAGGTWSSGSTAIATAGSTTGVITGVTAGTSIITYTESAAKCISTATVTVNTPPNPITGTPAACVGSTTALTTTSTGGTWTSSNTAIATVNSSGTVGGVAAGTAIITYTIPSGCIDTMLVTVYALPTSITGNTSICSGLTTTLNSTPAGGTWTSGSTAIATVGSTTGVVTGVTGGTALISYSYSPAACSVTKTVTVNAGPSAITGTTGICIGSNTTLTSSPTGGTWSSSASAIASVSSGGVVSGLSTGTAIITYSIPPSGCYDTIVVTVTSGVSPITGTLNVCTAQTTNLADVTTGGTWSSTNTSIATVGSTGIVTGVAAGTDTIKYSLSGGCFASVVVTVTTGPSAIAPSGAISLCVTNTTPFTDPTPGGVWSSSNTAIATVGSTGTVTAVAVGTATISYSIGTCSATKVVTVTSGGGANTPASATLCIGTGLTFTNPASGGTWSSSNTAIATINSSGLAGGVAVGTATISYTVGTCISTSPVTVSTAPAAIAPSAPVSICTGSTTPFADPTTGGVWSSGNTAIATVGSTGIVTGVTAGTATISYTIGGCSSTKVVTVTAGGSPITPPTAVICTSNTVNLTDATPGGAWSSSSTAIATVTATGTVTGVTAGVVTIDYTIGTCVATASITVSPGAAPISPAGASICIGSTVTLTDATGSGTWSSTNTGVATVSGTGVVTGVAGGTTTISYTIGTCAATAIVTVTTSGSPIVPAGGTVCIGTPVTFTDAGTGGTWSISSSAVATVTSGGVVTGLTSGTATLSYTVGTCIATAPITVNAAPGPISPSGALAICTANTISMTDGTPGGSWSTSNTAVATVNASGLVSGVSAGTVTITYSIGGCYATQVLTVTAGAAPISPSAPNICTGNTLALTEAVGGGTWSSLSTGIATVSASGVVTGVSVGTAVISYTLGSCGTSVTVTVSLAASAGTITGPTEDCVGSIITLLDATPGGTWTSSSPGIANVSSSGVVTGMSAGVATISYSVTNGCGTASATHIVTVDPSSGAGTITGTMTLCAGTTTTLSDIVPGGTWSSSNTAVATVNAAGLVTGVSTGTATITYSVSNACGSAITTANVTVGAFLTAGTIFGPSSLCGVGPITMIDITPGGTWGSTNPGIATVSGTGNVFGTGAGSGVDTITYTVTAACGSAVATHVVTVSAGPDAGTISGTSTVCVGSSTTLTDPAPGGVWSSYNTNATVSTVGLVTGMATGTDTIYYAVTNACGTAIAKFPITIVTGVSAGTITGPSTMVCLGSSMTVTDLTPGGSWGATNGHASVSGGGVVTGMTPGVDTITYTVSSSCGPAVATYVVTVSPTSLSAGSISGPSSVCVSSVITLVDTVSGGAWSASNGNATITTGGLVTGIVPGLDTITFTVTGACGIAQTTKVINVIGLPTPGSISGPAGVCIAGTAVYSVTGTTGGSWTISNTNATIGALSGVVVGVTAGTSVITYSLTNVCGTVIATMNISISAPPTVDAITGVTSECVGATTTLSDATFGGAWSSSNTAVSVVDPAFGTVTGIAAGVDTIYYTVTVDGCAASAWVRDTVKTVPVPTPISGPTVFCAYTSHTMSNPMAGGIWASSNPVVATIDATTGVVTGLSGGTATIYYFVSNGCGSITDSVHITVNPGPYPGVITAPTSDMCGNTTLTLTDTVSGGVWSSSNTTVATVGSTGIVYGLTIGYDTIYYTVSNGFGCAASAAFVVHVTDIMPSVVFAPSGTATLCRGHYVYMHVIATGGGGGLTYQWKQDGAIIPGATDSTYVTYTSGVFSVVVSSGACSVTLTGTTVIMAPPNPVISFTPPNILYTSSFVSYQWFLNWVPIPGATTSLYHMNTNGVYHVVVTDINGCTDTSGQYSAVVVTGVTNVINPQDIRIYPNPVSNILNVEAPGKVNVTIMSVDGKVLIDQKEAVTINVAGLSDGIYLIMVYDENKLLLKTAKFAKLQ